MKTAEIKKRSLEIRSLYHRLEEKYHGKIWTVEEDALAFLSDAGLVGRLVMAQQGRWPSEQIKELPNKIGECIWWLAVLAERTGCSFEDCIESFLNEKLKDLKED